MLAIGSRLLALVLMLVSLAPHALWAAPPSDVHYQYRLADAPPGLIGASQLERGGPLPGYFQPVSLTGPEGIRISLVVDDQFQEERAAPVTVGLLIGQVYRLRITHIPLQEGREVYPTLEVVNRLYPPRGQETKFPIPIELTREELEFALAGKYVTRVIYLEDPQTAIANRQGPGIPQPYFETLPNEGPLQVADRLGRPMAILRMGSRVPDAATDARRFAFGSPAYLEFGAVPAAGGARGLEPSPGPLPLPQESPPPALPAELPASPPPAESP